MKTSITKPILLFALVAADSFALPANRIDSTSLQEHANDARNKQDAGGKSLSLGLA